MSQIGLAPGETPNLDADSALPVPLPILTQDDFLARAGRWSVLRIRLINVTSDPHRGAHRALVKLQDGTRIQIDYLSSSQASEWRANQGRTLTLLGRPPNRPTLARGWTCRILPIEPLRLFLILDAQRRSRLQVWNRAFSPCFSSM